MADSIRVLHVDDDPEFADVASRSLEREDDQFVVETLCTAEAALERLGEADVDCVVSDHEMPGRDGIEFLEAVRETYPDLPFVLFTGTGSEEVASEAISAGVTDYLQKGTGPDQYAVLANRVHNAVDHYRSREALAERNRELRKYERMVHSMREAACIYDADGRFELVNDYLADWYGTTRDALVGERSNLVPRIRERWDGDPYRELLDGERGEIRGEFEAEFPDHGHAVLEYRLTPLTVDDAVEGAVGVARDVTERTAHERRLERQNERLDEFASVISHDLRSPLTVAEGRLELAREGCDSEHLEPIGDALERIDYIVEDVLLLAREGRDIGTTEPVPLSEAAATAWAMTGEGHEGAELVRRAGLGTVEADPDRLGQLLENLFRNAVEHGGEGVTLTVGPLDDGFYAEDTGPGIPPGDREDAFEAGYSTAEDGTGFGLSIVERVADAHGWDVTVVEGSEGGARFEVTGVTRGA